MKSQLKILEIVDPHKNTKLRPSYFKQRTWGRGGTYFRCDCPSWFHTLPLEFWHPLTSNGMAFWPVTLFRRKFIRSSTLKVHSNIKKKLRSRTNQDPGGSVKIADFFEKSLCFTWRSNHMTVKSNSVPWVGFFEIWTFNFLNQFLSRVSQLFFHMIVGRRFFFYLIINIIKHNFYNL